MNKRLFVGLLLAGIALIYGNTLVNGFVSDDELYITRNAQVVDPSLHRLFSPNPVSNVFRPVTFATFALNWKLGGANPVGYHLLNLLLHAGATWLLYILLLELIGSTPEGKTIALVAALLYAVHPIHTEAVAWAVGRAELLAAGFLFAGWILHLRDRPLPIARLLCTGDAVEGISRRVSSRWFSLAITRSASGNRTSNTRWKAGSPLLYLGLLWKIQGGSFGQQEFHWRTIRSRSLPAGWRILNAPRVAWKYVALQIYPAVLSSDYSFNQIPMYRDWRHTLPAALAAAAAVSRLDLGGTQTAGGMDPRGRDLFRGLCDHGEYSGSHRNNHGRAARVSSFRGILPLVGAWLELASAGKADSRWGLLATIAFTFSVRTVVRNQDWKDPLALFSSAARAVPNSVRAHVNLGTQYEALNQLDLAAQEYRIALSILPDSAPALAAYSGLEFRRGNYAAARPMMEKALSLSEGTASITISWS